jgi:hypothetical protein
LNFTSHMLALGLGLHTPYCGRVRVRVELTSHILASVPLHVYSFHP